MKSDLNAAVVENSCSVLPAVRVGTPSAVAVLAGVRQGQAEVPQFRCLLLPQGVSTS